MSAHPGRDVGTNSGWVGAASARTRSLRMRASMLHLRPSKRANRRPMTSLRPNGIMPQKRGPPRNRQQRSVLPRLESRHMLALPTPASELASEYQLARIATQQVEHGGIDRCVTQLKEEQLLELSCLRQNRARRFLLQL